MKKLIILTLVLYGFNASAQISDNRLPDNQFLYQMNIGKKTKAVTDPSSWLEIGKDSTNKGFRLPRVADTSNISSPAYGLLIYQIKDSSIYFRDTHYWINILNSRFNFLYSAYTSSDTIFLLSIKGDTIPVKMNVDSVLYVTHSFLDSSLNNYAKDSVVDSIKNSTITITPQWGITGGGSDQVINNPNIGVGVDTSQVASLYRVDSIADALQDSIKSKQDTGTVILNQQSSKQNANAWIKKIISDTLTNVKSPNGIFDISTSSDVGVYIDNVALNPRFNTYGSSSLYFRPNTEYTIFQSNTTNSTLQIQASGGYSRLRFYGGTNNKIESNSGDITISPASNTIFSSGNVKINNTPTGSSLDSFVVKATGNSLGVIAASTLHIIDTVNNIESLESYSGYCKLLVVTDTLRGGLFIYSQSESRPDSGTVFPADGKGSGYWIRSYDRNTVNILWFGAKPDSSEDATTEIQNAILSVDKNNNKDGGTVYIPAGIYKVSSPIELGDSVTLMGDGWASAIFLADGSNCDMFINNPENDFHYAVVRNLQFWGNNANNTIGSCFSITYNGHTNSDIHFDDILIAHFADDGIYIEDGWQINVVNSIIEFIKGSALHFKPNRAGISSTNDVRRLFISNNGIYKSSEVGADYTKPTIFFDGSDSTYISGIVMTGNRVEGYTMQSSTISLNYCTDFNISGNRITTYVSNTNDTTDIISIYKSDLGNISSNNIGSYLENHITDNKIYSGINLIDSCTNVTLGSNEYYMTSSSVKIDTSCKNISIYKKIIPITKDAFKNLYNEKKLIPGTTYNITNATSLGLSVYLNSTSDSSFDNKVSVPGYSYDVATYSVGGDTLVLSDNIYALCKLDSLKKVIFYPNDNDRKGIDSVFVTSDTTINNGRIEIIYSKQNYYNSGLISNVSNSSIFIGKGFRLDISPGANFCFVDVVANTNIKDNLVYNSGVYSHSCVLIDTVLINTDSTVTVKYNSFGDHRNSPTTFPSQPIVQGYPGGYSPFINSYTDSTTTVSFYNAGTKQPINTQLSSFYFSIPYLQYTEKNYDYLWSKVYAATFSVYLTMNKVIH